MAQALWSQPNNVVKDYKKYLGDWLTNQPAAGGEYAGLQNVGMAELSKILSGAYLDPTTNPALMSSLNETLRQYDVGRTGGWQDINRLFTESGHSPTSTAWADTLGRYSAESATGRAGLASQSLMQSYLPERQIMSQALQMPFDLFWKPISEMGNMALAKLQQPKQQDTGNPLWGTLGTIAAAFL